MIWCIKQIYFIYTLYNQVWNKCGLISTPLKKIYSFESLHITTTLQFQLNKCWFTVWQKISQWKSAVTSDLTEEQLVTGYGMCFQTQLSFRLIARCMTAAGHMWAVSLHYKQPSLHKSKTRESVFHTFFSNVFLQYPIHFPC